MPGSSLRWGDPGYGPKCPECGGPKDERARRCVKCRYGEDATGLTYVGRVESIITYRNRETAALLTRHCHGPTVPAQVADGLRGLPEEWVVECRSTPDSILQDLRGRRKP